MPQYLQGGELVIGLCRRSTIDDRQADSLPSQKRMIREFQDRNNLVLEEVVPPPFENGILEYSGSSIDVMREDIDQIIDFTRKGFIKSRVLVVTNIDRLTRDNPLELGRRLEPFKRFNIKLVIVNAGPQIFDIRESSDADALVRFAYAAHSYIDSLSTNVVRGLYNRAADKKTPPKRCFGFDVISIKDDENRRVKEWKLIPNEDELEILQKIGRGYIAGKSKIKLVEEINKNFTTLKGNAFKIQTIEELLINPIFTGDWVRFRRQYGKLKSVGKGGVAKTYSRNIKYDNEGNEIKGKAFYKQNEDNLVFENYFPELAIFTKEEHQQILARFKDKKYQNKSSTRRKWAFSGKAKCGMCGGYLRGFVDTFDRRWYECENSRRAGVCKHRKKISEVQLTYQMLCHMYFYAVLNPQKILELVAETKTGIDRGPKWVELNYKVKNLKQSKIDSLENGDTEEAKAIQERIDSYLSEMNDMDANSSFDVERYPQDRFSLTSEFVVANDLGLVKAAKHLLAEIDFEDEKIGGVPVPTKELVDDVLKEVSVFFEEVEKASNNGTKQIRKHFKPSYLELEYRCGLKLSVYQNGWHIPHLIKQQMKHPTITEQQYKEVLEKMWDH